MRRVVQPKIIEEKPVRGDQRLSQENPSKESSDDKTMTNDTVVQVCGWSLSPYFVHAVIEFYKPQQISQHSSSVTEGF